MANCSVNQEWSAHVSESNVRMDNRYIVNWTEEINKCRLTYWVTGAKWY